MAKPRLDRRVISTTNTRLILALPSRALCFLNKLGALFQVLFLKCSMPLPQNILPLMVISSVFLLCDYSFVFVDCSTGLVTL